MFNMGILFCSKQKAGPYTGRGGGSTVANEPLEVSSFVSNQRDARSLHASTFFRAIDPGRVSSHATRFTVNL